MVFKSVKLFYDIILTMDESKLFEFIKNQEWDKFIKNINPSHDVNIQDEHSNYMIQYIILYNNIKSLTTILKYDVVLDWIDTEGKTILYIPIKYGYIEIIKKLLEYDKDNIGIFLLNGKDSQSLFPIHYAIKFKNYPIYELLLETSKVTIIDSGGNTLLHLTTLSKKVNYLKALLLKNININSINRNNESALHIACTYDLNNFIEILLERKIDINIQEMCYGFTAIFIALLNNNTDGVLLMMKNDIDINLQDHTGNTIFHIAIMENNFEVMEQCIKDSKLQPNITNLDGNTYLHLILDKVMTESIDINKYNIESLLENSILNIQNNNGQTIWHYLIKLNLFEHYESILVNTSNNLFINDKNNITPFSLIKSHSKTKLIDIVSQSYYNKLKDNIWNEEWENNCTDHKHKKKCLEKIKETIENENKSVPVKKTNYCINIEDPKFVSFTTFTGINFDVITSYIELKKNLPTLFTSIVEDFSINCEVEKYYNKLGIIKDLDNEYLNFEIFWLFQQLILPTQLLNTIETFKKSDHLVMAIPIAIEIALGAHANVIIIDKRFETIERFEPNGKNEPINYNYNSNLLDNMLEMYFKKIFDYTYLSSKLTQQIIGFQSLEVYENDKMKKIGDPGGFCVGWCIWYVEQRVKYNIHPMKLANKLIIKIRSKNISFKKLIRLYVNNILTTRNIILDQLKIDINDIRNNNIDKKQKNDIQQLIKYELLNV
jgi:ankyrin repeat protein